MSKTDRMAEDKKLKRNASGSSDPTAYEAIKKIDGEYERFNKLLTIIFNICELSGFRIDGRITLVDLKTGREWR